MSNPMNASKQLVKSISRLAPHAIALTAGSTLVYASELSSETATLIASAKRLIESRLQAPDESGTNEASLRVREAVAAIDRIAVPCDDHARVYLDLPFGVLQDSLAMQLITNDNLVGFTFTSGTALSYVAQVINGTGIMHAEAASENWQRLELRSTIPGSEYFVSVRQVQNYGEQPIVVGHALGRKPVYEWTDFGCADGIPCQTGFASAFLATGATITADNQHAIGFVVWGEHGPQAFAFLSGTTASVIADEIDSWMFSTGVFAQLNEGAASNNEVGIVLRAIRPGSQSFVSVTQLNGSPLIHPAPGAGAGMLDFTDIGSNRFPGDVDGNGVIDQDDLGAIVNAWGNCPIVWPPEIPAYCPADLTQDHQINIDDLLVIIQHWGPGRCP